jgi:hypothetical protein
MTLVTVAPSGREGVMRPPPRIVIATLAVGLLVARLLGAHFIWFYQNDEVALAAGVAALARHSTTADVYRYGPQVGYYRLVQAMTTVLGGHLRAIPIVMITLSVLAGVVIPLCALVAFPRLLSDTERWVLAGLLTVHPMLWMSSTYGNSAMPSTALLVAAVTILSNRPGAAGEAAALALYGAAVLIRADAVFVAPLIALLLFRHHGGVRPVVTRAAPLVAGLGLVYAILFLADPHMATTLHGIAGHLTNPTFETRFWTYLLWSTSPFILGFAVIGVREMLVERRALLAIVALWCLPFFAFYYGSTTSPRYFVPTAMPVAMCASVGLVALLPALAPLPPRIGAILLGLLATLHLFIGLERFTPGSPKNLLRQSQLDTQVGPLWTGAYLYKTYFTPWFLARSLWHPGFGQLNQTEHWLDGSLAEIAAGAQRGRTVVVLLGGWNGHVFHYYAHVHGATYTSRAPGPEYATFATETWMTLGGARLMSIRWASPWYRALPRLPVGAGDQIWILAFNGEIDRSVRAQIPPDLALVTDADPIPAVRRYRVVTAAP